MSSLMTSKDQLAFECPQTLSIYAQAIYKQLIAQEEIHQITPHDYLKTV